MASILDFIGIDKESLNNAVDQWAQVQIVQASMPRIEQTPPVPNQAYQNSGAAPAVSSGVDPKTVLVYAGAAVAVLGLVFYLARG